MADIKRRIQEIVQPVLDPQKAFLVDVLIRNDQSTRIIQVLVDTDRGITIDECAEISRELGKEIEAGGIIDEPYHLEVSSPGLDRPLRLLRQYPKNIGRIFKVRYVKDSAQSELVGTLSGVDGNQVRFSVEKGEPLTIAFENIIESKEELPW